MMLDGCGYSGRAVLRKHIIDNSCGEGAFLCSVVRRYCEAFLRVSQDRKILLSELQTFIHGIEIDEKTYHRCILNLTKTVERFGISEVQWDILNADALLVTQYDKQMDFVVGNPPYVRVHHLEDNYHRVKSFSFAGSGMTDLYIVFFEIGFRMLNPSGKMAYITPSSWLNSVAATRLRNDIMYMRRMTEVIDLGHYQVFENVTTYVLISFFDNGITNTHVNYYEYDAIKRQKQFIDCLAYEDFCIGGNFFFSKLSALQTLYHIKQGYNYKYVSCKNGFATLADKVFITDVSFDVYTIPILKASTGKWYKGFFPYDCYGKPLPKKQLFDNLCVANYLNTFKKTLLKGKREEEKKDWYLYGRTQALKDVFVDKIAINTLIKGIDSIRLNKVPNGSGIYSGLYILTTQPFELIEKILKTEEFIDYLKLLKNYKSGGYYTFNTKDLEQYLNTKLSSYEKQHTISKYNKREVYQSSLELL